ncbi:hypothetical protein GVAV_001381 [Gurleya vavrai]
MNYNEDVIKNFHKSLSINFTNQPHTLNYYSTGDSLCVSFPSYFHIYDPLNAKIFTKVDIPNNKAQFFSKNTLLLSNKNTISYLSFYDTTLLRKFNHSSDVKGFSISDNDTIMSFSDKITLFDIKSQHPIHKIKMNSAFGTFLNENNFIVGNSSILRFYDLRNTKGPVKLQNLCNIEKAIFYKNSNTLVLHNNVKRTHIFMNDEGFTTNKIVFDQKYNADLTSDGRFYLASSANVIKVYEVTGKGNVFTYRDAELAGGCIAINPAYAQFVTSNNNLRYWLPDFDE